MSSEEDYELKELYQTLGNLYPQKSELLFIKAITHSSADGKPGSNYEQLEFLGDAILSVVVAEFLYKNFPLKNEGDLTKMRSFIVSRQQLNQVALEIPLYPFIRHKIDANQIKQAKDLGGDVIESLIGAYYLDGGLETARKFIHKWVLKEKRVALVSKKAIDPKSELHEWTQRKKKNLEFRQKSPNIQNPKEFEIEVWIDGVEYGHAKGSTKKAAEKKAALATLNRIYSNAR